jgi:peptidoglycan/xylan/chitin deacetylase (PgdA/CDA1 family)
MIAAGVTACLGAAGLGTLAAGVYLPNFGLFGPVVGRGARSGHTLYVTFDDGPSPSATESILDTLARHEAPAAFFMVGEHVRLFPEIARRVAGAGHEVGNHTQHHRKLHRLGPRAIARELEEAHAVLIETSGRTPRTFRAPHGFRNPFVHAAARRLGYHTFGWSVGVWDTAKPGAEEIRRRVRAHLSPGAIVLLHDGDGSDPRGDRTQTAAALDGILRDARDAGYEFRPLGELIPG